MPGYGYMHPCETRFSERQILCDCQSGPGSSRWIRCDPLIPDLGKLIILPAYGRALPYDRRSTSSGFPVVVRQRMREPGGCASHHEFGRHRPEAQIQGSAVRQWCLRERSGSTAAVLDPEEALCTVAAGVHVALLGSYHVADIGARTDVEHITSRAFSPAGSRGGCRSGLAAHPSGGRYCVARPRAPTQQQTSAKPPPLA